MKKLLLLMFSLFLVCCASVRPEVTTPEAASPKSKPPAEKVEAGLLVIDAQKFFIPGHPESIYAILNDTSHHVHTVDTVIPAMTKVIDWANRDGLPIVATYEAKNTEGYALPEQLEAPLEDAHRFVKMFYDATKHEAFMKTVEESGVKNWFVIGAETDVCVYQTTLGLLGKGFEVTLIKDAVYSGRNDTSVAWANLEKAGASVISFEEADSFEFKAGEHAVPAVPDQTKLVVTVLKGDAAAESGNTKRLEHLKAWAKVTSTQLEEYASAAEIPSSEAPRVFAGAVSEGALESVQANSANIVLVDAVTTEPPAGDYQRQTFKLFAYRLMASAKFYHVEPEELEGWQVAFKKAVLAETVPYLEGTQNEK